MFDEFPADWAKSLIDEGAFREEQRRLAYVWTFLGFSRDVANDGDWFRASIATRSVFVQRFGDTLRAFENICAHRSYPLRIEAKGNGPVVCGFHHWKYDKEGKVIGIPICKMVYGKQPHEVGARLNPIEIALCGDMIFGRFPSANAAQSLEAYLGDAFPILAFMSRMDKRPMAVERAIHANWRLNMHISMDDYHSPSVHPTTLGHDGYIPSMSMRRYFRFGVNSAYLYSDDDKCFEKLLDGCRDGSYRPSHFFVFQILPDLVVALVDADRPFWYCNVLQYSAVAHDRTALRSWSYASPFATDFSWFTRSTRPITDFFRNPIYMYFYKKVVDEDIAVCERIQGVANHIDKPPFLGALEERIGWFETSVRDLTTDKS